MLYETLYTFADHYLRLLCVNFGRAALGSRIEKRDDVFPLIYYLHWATEREQGGKRKKKKFEFEWYACDWRVDARNNRARLAPRPSLVCRKQFPGDTTECKYI